jgi:hypothetical protein
MPAIIPDEGREWFSQSAMSNTGSERAYIVAVGTGTGATTASNTDLDNEIYRANDDDSVCTVEATSNTGEILARITVSGGTEIQNPPQDITELGLFVSDGSTLLYREVRSAVTVEAGESQTFEFTLVVEDG